MKCSDDQVRPFPLSLQFQNGPRRQGFASPRKTRAPLTAPGRSEPVLTRGKNAPERFWCKLLRTCKCSPSECRDYAAITAAQIAGIVVGRPGSLPTLN